MTDGSFRKVSLDAVAALESIPTEVWVWGLAPALDLRELLALRALSNEWRAIITQDDVWMPKLTALALQYPALSHLDQASGEPSLWAYRRKEGLSTSAPAAACGQRPSARAS